MIILYIMLLGGSLILGILDGDITAFMVFFIFGIAYGADKLLKNKKKVRGVYARKK